MEEFSSLPQGTHAPLKVELKRFTWLILVLPLKYYVFKVKCKKSKKNESESAASEDNTPTLRIHFGKGKLGNRSATGGAIVSALASAAANGGTRLHESIRLSRPPLSASASPNSSKPWLRQV